MSADNGIVIAKGRDGRFYVYEYCASVDYRHVEDMGLLSEYKSLEQALSFASDYGSEYGVNYQDLSKEPPRRE
jgi:hypothetical protein